MYARMYADACFCPDACVHMYVCTMRAHTYPYPDVISWVPPRAPASSGHLWPLSLAPALAPAPAAKQEAAYGVAAARRRQRAEVFLKRSQALLGMALALGEPSDGNRKQLQGLYTSALCASATI